MRPATFVLLAALMVGVALGQPQPAAPPKPLPHPDTVYAVAFSADGKSLATGCFDKAARVFDVASGKELRAIAGKAAHQNLVVGVAYSADGTQLVTTSTDNTAKVWGLPSDKPLAVFQQRGGQGVGRLAVAPDGKAFVSSAGLLPLRRWDIADPTKAADLGGHSGFVTGIQYSANGATLSTFSATQNDSTIKYWNAADGKELGGLGTGGNPAGMWVNPTSGVVTTYSPDGSLRQWPAALPVMKSLANAPAKARQAITSADGAQLLVALEDQSVRVWNPAAGGESKVVVEKLPPGFFQIALHPTNGTLAITDMGKVKFVGLDGKPRGELPVQGFLSGMAFHPTEAKFQLVGVTGTAQTWAMPKPDDKEKKDAKPLATRPTVPFAPRAALLPTTNQAITIDKDGAVAVWDTTDGKEAKKARDLGKVGPQPNTLAVSRDGSLVAAASLKVLKVWQVADGKELPFGEQSGEVQALAFNADKTRLAVSTGNSTVTVYALPGGHAEQFVVHKGQVRGVAFHPTQPILFTAGDDTTVRATPLAIVKYTSDPVRFGKLLTGYANGVSFLTAGTGEGVFRVNTGNLTTEATFGKSKAVSAVVANKANTLVAVAEEDGTVTVFNANNAAESGSFKAPAKVLDLAFHPTLPQLAGVLADKRAMTWNVAFDPAETKPEEKRFGTRLQEVPHDRAAVVAYTPDGSTLLTGGGDAALRTWKVIGEAARFSLTHPSMVNGAAFSKDGNLLATAGQDGVVRVFDLTKPAGTAPKEIKAHISMTGMPAQPQPQPVYAVLFTPDAKQVISCSFDKTAKIHDVADGKLVKEIKAGGDKLPGHTDAVYAIALSLDGKTLATGSADRTVKLWNPATGELLRELKNTLDPKQKEFSHPGYVHGLKFTADGKTLVTAGTAPKNKGYLATWTVADGKQLTGQELDIGPIHAVDVRADGLIALGCGAKSRTQSAADVVLMPMPK